MVVCEDPHWAYYAPPKTGTRTVLDRLKHCGWRQHEGNKHEIAVPPDYKKYFHFVTVRNPFSRMVSIWSHLQNKIISKWPTPHRQRLHDETQGLSFDQFLHDERWSAWDIEKTVRMQCEYLSAMPFVNHVIRHETFEQDFRQLPFAGRSDKPLPRLNKGLYRKDKPWWEHYTMSGEQLVRERYAEDFQATGYSMSLDEAIAV